MNSLWKRSSVSNEKTIHGFIHSSVWELFFFFVSSINCKHQGVWSEPIPICDFRPSIYRVVSEVICLAKAPVFTLLSWTVELAPFRHIAFLSPGRLGCQPSWSAPRGRLLHVFFLFFIFSPPCVYPAPPPRNPARPSKWNNFAHQVTKMGFRYVTSRWSALVLMIPQVDRASQSPQP